MKNHQIHPLPRIRKALNTGANTLKLLTLGLLIVGFTSYNAKASAIIAQLYSTELPDKADDNFMNTLPPFVKKLKRIRVSLTPEQINAICSFAAPYKAKVTADDYLEYKKFYRGNISDDLNYLMTNDDSPDNRFKKGYGLFLAGNYTIKGALTWGAETNIGYIKNEHGKVGDNVAPPLYNNPPNLNNADMHFHSLSQNAKFQFIYAGNQDSDALVLSKINNTYIAYIQLVKDLRTSLMEAPVEYKGSSVIASYSNIGQVNQCLSLRDQEQQWDK